VHCRRRIKGENCRVIVKIKVVMKMAERQKFCKQKQIFIIMIHQKSLRLEKLDVFFLKIKHYLVETNFSILVIFKVVSNNEELSEHKRH
jgi:transcription antitermination factor NusA-like protein